MSPSSVFARTRVLYAIFFSRAKGHGYIGRGRRRGGGLVVRRTEFTDLPERPNARRRCYERRGGRAHGLARSIRETPGGVVVPRPVRQYPSTPYRPPRGQCTGQWLSRASAIITRTTIGFIRQKSRVPINMTYYTCKSLVI